MHTNIFSLNLMSHRRTPPTDFFLEMIKNWNLQSTMASTLPAMPILNHDVSSLQNDNLLSCFCISAASSSFWLFFPDEMAYLPRAAEPTFKSRKEWQLVAKIVRQRPLKSVGRSLNNCPSFIRPWLACPRPNRPNLQPRLHQLADSEQVLVVLPLRTLIGGRRKKTDLQPLRKARGCFIIIQR